MPGRDRPRQQQGGPTQGLIGAPLNDLSHEPKAWAFNQAYFYAGCERLARLLRELQHPRAAEFQEAANQMRQAVERGFGAAAMRGAAGAVARPHLDALRAGRRLHAAAVAGDLVSDGHRFGAAAPVAAQGPRPRGPLTTFLLHDHEDNLFLNGWGMANEPVYNQHATAYLLRDEVKPAIRAFYSMLACAFSHSALEPVEHRWAWGQYFGPPSTDGAWFDLYRHMLIHEQDDDTLLLLQATPRKWLEDGKADPCGARPDLLRAVESVGHESRRRGRTARHGRDAQPQTSAGVIGSAPASGRETDARGHGQWPKLDGFRPRKEWVRIAAPKEDRYEIVARY